MSLDSDLRPKAEYLMNYLDLALEKLNDTTESSEYKSFLHGQVYGIAMTLRILFPGPGNWGEKAAFKLRPFLSEKNCSDDEKA